VPDVNVKVVLLIDAGFIALLKVAVTIVLGHASTAPLGGATEITVAGTKPGLVPVLSGSLHPVATMSSRNAGNQILGLLYLRMTVILLPLGFTAAGHQESSNLKTIVLIEV